MRERPPIERYVRCSVIVGDWTVEPGLEWREGDDFDRVTAELAAIAEVIGAEAVAHGPMQSARRAETVFELNWPGRAFFVEVHDAVCARWTQTYQPYGVPRNP